SALAEEESLSPEEREEARANLLLARYGVVARELARGDWATLRHTLLRMEYGGDVVRGYFVEGLSGEQYALQDAMTDLAAPARRPGQPRGACLADRQAGRHAPERGAPAPRVAALSRGEAGTPRRELWPRAHPAGGLRGRGRPRRRARAAGDDGASPHVASGTPA